MKPAKDVYLPKFGAYGNHPLSFLYSPASNWADKRGVLAQYKERKREK